MEIHEFKKGERTRHNMTYAERIQADDSFTEEEKIDNIQMNKRVNGPVRGFCK